MVEIKMHHPFEYDGQTISSVTLKRPKGKHIKKLPVQPTTEDLLVLAAKLSDHPTTVYDEMDAADVLLVAEAIGNFLDNGQKTGKS